MRDLNYNKFMSSGEIKISKSLEYNSNNTKQLSVYQTAIFKKQNFIKKL